MLKAIQKELELKLANFQQRVKQKENLIEGLREEVKKSEIDKLKFSRALLAEPDRQTDNYQQPQRQSALKTSAIKEDFQELRERYEELIQSYRNMEERGHKDKLDAKNYRNKFWQLK